MLQYGITHETIQIKVCDLHLNQICCNILNLSTMIGKTMRYWIVAINDPMMYKSILGPFGNLLLYFKTHVSNKEALHHF